MNPRHRSQYPWALLGFVALVLLIESSVAAHEHYYVRPERWDWRYCGQSARANLARFKILCFGDSQMKNGGYIRSLLKLAARNPHIALHPAVAHPQRAISSFGARFKPELIPRYSLLVFIAISLRSHRTVKQLPHSGVSYLALLRFLN